MHSKVRYKPTSEHCARIWEARRTNGTDRHSTEAKQKMSLQRKGKPSSFKGCAHSAESIEKNRNAHRGANNSMYDRKHSSETLRKMRVSAVKRLKKDGIISLGSHEKELLDRQEQLDRCTIIRQWEVPDLGFIVDGYDPLNNRVYEVYEKFHDKQVFDDLERETSICNQLSCDFHIIWDKQCQQSATLQK